MRLVLFLILLLLVGGYVGWPYYALYRIHVALADGDTAELEELVDWRSVRAAMEREMADRNLAGAGDAAAGAATPPGGFAALVAPKFGQFLADAHASPRGLARLIRDSGPASLAAQAGHGAGSNDQPVEAFRPDVVAALAYARDQVDSAWERGIEAYRRLRRDYDYLFFTSPYTFEARHTLRSPDQTEPLVLILRFQNLTWRLARVDLPRARSDEGG